jgi:magnesium transporter
MVRDLACWLFEGHLIISRGIPPMLVAGIYGMNFKFMPELDWVGGYPFGLTMIALTALIPLVWFK